MKILFQINHPAHYHLLKNSIKNLKSNGKSVHILATDKDVIKDLLQNESYDMLTTQKGKNIFEKIIKIRKRNKEIINYVTYFKPNIVVGTGPFAFITRKLKIPTIFFAEDDVNLNLLIFIVAFYNYPFFSEIITPQVCNNSIWNNKSIKYNGYQKLAYLHPNHFTPDKKVVEKYFSADKPYFIIRFAKLNAYHDVGIEGINTEIAQNIFNTLESHGDIYISSERELEPQFEKYRLNINPLDIHHVMSFAKLYIGDSQSMSVEAAMLGIPSIRFNDFAGKIGVLEELEHKYQLTFGIRSSEPRKLYEKIESLLKTENLKELFQQRRQKMLADKIDVTAFYTWFIENYPESSKIMKENPEYQYNFK